MTENAAVRGPLSVEARGLVEGLAAALPPAEGALVLGPMRDGLPLADVAARLGMTTAEARGRWRAVVRAMGGALGEATDAGGRADPDAATP